ncbi:MAG: hypothetical protein ABTQ73_04790 [Caldilineales bacterium]
MQRKHTVFLLALLILLAVLIPATVLAQGPGEDQETLLEQAKARAAEQNPEAASLSTPLMPNLAVDYPLFVGVDDATVPAYQMDVTDSSTIQAFIGAQVWGSAYDVLNQIVYFNNGSTLYAWPVGGAISTLGSIVDAAGAAQSMVGLAFYGGQLYGVKNIANEAIWSINTTTLVATVAIDYVDADLDCGGFAADPETGVFYCTNDDATPYGASLVIINPDTTVTPVVAYPAGETDIDGLAISNDGFAYMVTDQPGNIYVYDLAGAVYATPLTAPWTSSEVFSAATWIWEEPMGGQCPAGPETGELTANDPLFNRPVGSGGSCTLSGVGTAVHYDVYSYYLDGTPPQDLFASLLGGTTLDTVMVFYQVPDGSQNPFDATQPCLNTVAYNDDFGGTLQSQISATGLAVGWVDVVVTTFDNGDTGPYTMNVTSQSCQGGGEPNIVVDPLSMALKLFPDESTTRPLTISNTGDITLTWMIEEEATMAAPAAMSGGPGKIRAPQALLRTDEKLQQLLAAPSADLVQDGSFEAGTPNPFWNESSTNFGTPLCDSNCGSGGGTGPLIGDWWAWFGGITLYEAGNVSQSVVIPTGGSATLSFWIEQTTCSGNPADYLDVLIDGTTLWSTTGDAPECGVLGYRQVTVDVSAFADDGAHLLEFNSETQGGSITNFFVDEVMLNSDAVPACAAPVDIPWLSVAPTAGATASMAASTATVTFNAAGLAPGMYTGNLCISSNDPDAGPGNETEMVIVPVTLTVSMPLEPSIIVTKTVGTVPGVCATESSILVAAGTTVYYCYTVTNTGNVIFTTHDLYDDQLGQIFSGLAYVLNPGASVNTVTAGLSVPAVINTPTVNVATWTAYDRAGGPATASATAFVDVYAFSCEYPVENFEAGVPPLGWSVVNHVTGGPTWTNLAACGQGNYTGGAGDAACMSVGTLAEQPFNAELRTPVFDLVGYNTVTVSYLANFQAWSGIDRLNLDISTDAGATWSNLLTWNSDMGSFMAAPGVFPTVDLSAYAGMSNLMLRWHYYYPQGAGLGWYAQVDEAHLKCTQGPPTAVTLAGVEATAAQSVPAGLPAAALPVLASLALGAAYVARRKQ